MAKKTTKDPQDVYAVWGTTQEEHQKQFMSFIEKMRAEAQERLDEMEKPKEKKKKERPALAGGVSPSRAAAIKHAAIKLAAITGKPSYSSKFKLKLKHKGQSVVSIKDVRAALLSLKGVKDDLVINPRTLVALKAQGFDITGLNVKGMEEFALTGKINGVAYAGLVKGNRKGGKKGKFRRGGRKGPVF